MKKITSKTYNYADNTELINMLIDNQNEIIEWISSVSERIGLMEDEYKQHLYGPGYKESDEQKWGSRKERSK